MAKRDAEERRRTEEWLAKQEPPYVIFDRVQKRLEERRARMNQSFFRRLFRRTA